MLYRTSIAALTAAATMTLSGMAYAQENTRPGQNPAEPPRSVEPSTPRTPDRTPAGEMKNEADRTMDTARDKMDSTKDRMAGAAGGDQTEHIRALAKDPMAGDKLWAMGAGMGNLWEVAFNELVAERAQTKEIKDHARMIAKDHQQAHQRLEALAEKHDVKLASSLPAEKQAKLEVFRAMPADKLETCWMTEMRAGHAKAITSYADHTKTLQNEDLRTYASETLPKLRQHGAEVNRIAAGKGLTSEAGTGTAAPTGMGNTGNTGTGNTGNTPTMNH